MPRKQTTKLHLQNFEKLLIETVLCSKIKLKRVNTIDPDDTAHYEPSHLDLQFANSAIVVFDALRVKRCRWNDSPRSSQI